MKRKFGFVLILAACLTFIACEKDSEEVEEPTPQTPVMKSTYNAVYNLKTFVPVKEGETVFKDSRLRLEYGEPIQSFGETVSATLEGGKEDQPAIELSKIMTESGQEVWMSNLYLIEEAQLVVVVADEATVFDTPKRENPTNDIVSKRTLLVVDRQAQNGFFQFAGWDEVLDKPYHGRYIKQTDVSSVEADVEGAKFLFLALLQEKGSNAQKALLEFASEYTSSIFIDDINQTYNELILSEGESETMEVTLPERATEEFEFAGLINDNDVNVRDFPYELDTEVVGQLNIGDTVDVTEKTVDEFTIGEVTSAWYRIAEPEGWVFGAFIDPQ